MEYKILKDSVIGYKNRLKNKKSQDYVDYKIIDDGVIGTIADGHSTDFFSYSDEGAKLACKAAMDVLENYQTNINELKKELEEYIIQKLICDRWKLLVDKHYKTINPVVYKTEYIKYSTTLLVALIRNTFRLYLKIGDGSIIDKKGNEFTRIINNKNSFIVDSIGRENSYEKIYYHLEEVNDDNELDCIILFSDGYENGFYSDEELFNSLQETILKYNKSVFSRIFLYNNYKKYLNKISETRSYDDISILFINLK